MILIQYNNILINCFNCILTSTKSTTEDGSWWSQSFGDKRTIIIYQLNQLQNIHPLLYWIQILSSLLFYHYCSFHRHSIKILIRHNTFPISSCLLTSAYYAQRHRNLHINPKFHITGLEEKIFDCSRNYAAVKLINNIPTILLNPQICEVNRHKQNKRIALSFSKKIVHRTKTKKNL